MLSYYRFLRFAAKLGRTLVSVNAPLLLPKILYFSRISQFKGNPQLLSRNFLSLPFLFPQWSRFWWFCTLELWFHSSPCNVVDPLSMFIFVGIFLQFLLSFGVWFSLMVGMLELRLFNGRKQFCLILYAKWLCIG